MDNIFLNVFFNLIQTCIFVLISYRYFQTVQLGGYTKHRFFKNVFLNGIWAYVLNLIITALCLLLYFLTGIEPVSMAAFLLSNIVFIFLILKAAKKTPLKLTKRIIRHALVFSAVLFCSIFLCFYYKTIFVSYLFQPILPFIVLMSMYIILPVENLIRHRYKIKAAKKLEKNKNLIKIGITGSFGKTNVKNILHKMLETKYNVISTPKSYNTPMGVALCVSKDLNDSTEIFICEMGARHKGDIKELCDMVKPSYALISTIGGQHLETFKSMENIKNEKFELALCAEKLNGVSFFNGDNDYGRQLYDKFKGRKFLCNNKCAYDSLSDKPKGTDLICNSDEFAYADIINQSKEGSKFILHIDGFILNCRTKLLGRHNINNIALAASCAYKLKVPLEDIGKAIENLESVSHRLEIIKGHNGVTVIDDSFNSNVNGFKFALEVLKAYDGGRKVLVTPGIVELGKIQYEENFKLAELIFKVCDYAIIVGKENSKAIKDGLDKQNFIDFIVVKNLKEAQKFLGEYLKPNDIVLFENDLPDNY